MTSGASSSGDRRRLRRVRVDDVSASCAAEGGVGATYAVQDVSIGGAFVSGEAALAPGTAIDMVLSVCGQRFAAARGQVVRAVPGPDGGAGLGIAFEALEARARDATEKLAQDARASPPIALVAGGGVSSGPARVVRAIGYSVITAKTPLEVIYHLEHGPESVATVVIGSDLGGCRGLELASFLADAYPFVGLVVVAPPRAQGPAPCPPAPLQPHQSA